MRKLRELVNFLAFNHEAIDLFIKKSVYAISTLLNLHVRTHIHFRLPYSYLINPPFGHKTEAFYLSSCYVPSNFNGQRISSCCTKLSKSWQLSYFLYHVTSSKIHVFPLSQEMNHERDISTIAKYVLAKFLEVRWQKMLRRKENIHFAMGDNSLKGSSGCLIITAYL